MKRDWDKIAFKIHLFGFWSIGIGTILFFIIAIIICLFGCANPEFHKDQLQRQLAADEIIYIGNCDFDMGMKDYCNYYYRIGDYWYYHAYDSEIIAIDYNTKD